MINMLMTTDSCGWITVGPGGSLNFVVASVSRAMGEKQTIKKCSVSDSSLSLPVYSRHSTMY